MSLQKFLSFADVFSNPFYFKVHGNDKLGTKPGFCLTLISMIIGIVAFIFLLEEMQQMKDPIVNVQTIQTLTGQSYTMPPGSLNSVIGMADKNYNPIINSISKTYFTIHFEICKNGNCAILNSEKCSDQLAEAAQQEFGADILYFQFAYCMNQTYQQTNSIDLSGGIFSLSSSRIFIITERCTNSTANDYICATEEELDEKLQDSYIIYGMQNYKFDPQNVEQPFQTFYYMASQEVVQGNPISIFFNYQISEIITETNFYFFFPQKNKKSILQMQNVFQDKQTKDNTILGKAIIILSNDRIIRTRSYKNILNLFGTLGGLMNIVFYIAKLLIIPVNWLEQRFYLYNNILRYENLEDYLKQNEKFKLPQLSFWDLLTKAKLRKKFFEDYQYILPKLEINYLINQIQLSNKISETFSKGDLFKNNFEESKPIFETKKNETIWKEIGKEDISKQGFDDAKPVEIQQKIMNWEEIPNEILNI